MIARSAFRFNEYQAVAFYANLQLAVRRILPHLLSELADVLDGDPISLPVPKEAPPEVPRLILGNKDQSIRMEISLLRTDVRWQRRTEERAVTLPQFSDFAVRAFSRFQELTQARPGRLALVVYRFQPHENPGKALAAHFCLPHLLLEDPTRKGPLNRPENFEIHAHKRFQLAQFRVNSWVRCKTGTIKVGDKRDRIILVEQDINTLPEVLEETELSDEEIHNFHRLCIDELETIIRLYFPDA